MYFPYFLQEFYSHYTHLGESPLKILQKLVNSKKGPIIGNSFGERKEKMKSYEMDMCSGPLPGKILRFAFPLMLSSILQLLFNAADVIVVGQFAGSTSLAAVGSTGAVTNLLTNIFLGLSIGTNVLVSHIYGAKQDKDLHETIHTSIMISLIGGVILLVLGILLTRPLLTLMGTPEDVIDKAALYMRVIFVGCPVMLVYNFGSAILRAIGDTKRPLYFLAIAGVLNIFLNLFFVIVWKMDVAGVALATVISQCLSMGLILRCLVHENWPLRLQFSKLKIYKDKLKNIVRIGLPAGLQGAIFSISNVLIQSTVNSFGSTVVAGNTAAANIEGFVYVAMNALYQSAISFTGQNMGAQKYRRINKILIVCQGYVVLFGLSLGLLALLFGHQLLGLYTSDPSVVEYGLLRMSIICPTYFLCGIMDTMVGSLRGMGYSIVPMVVSLTGACGLRILWIFTIFHFLSPTLTTLYLSYPVSWAITAFTHVVTFLIVRHKYPKDDMEIPTPVQNPA